MRRLNLFEFGDQQWFPQVLRDAETAYLAVAYRLLPLARCWAERISTVLDPGEAAEIVDLCSGSGGAMPSIIAELEARGHEARARLTDLYPNPKSAAHPHIQWLAEPVDATRVPPKLAGVRTMFSAFHHFRPDAAKAILKDAFDRRSAICIFESGPGTLLAACQHGWGSIGCTRANAVGAAVPLGLPGVHLPDSADAADRIVGRHGLDVAHLLAGADEGLNARPAGT